VGQRKIDKENTRLKLINVAKREFLKKGFLSTNTSDIAKKAGIAHGSIFFHFNTKETLINEVLESQLRQITDKLYPLMNDTDVLDKLIDVYFLAIEENEKFFCMVARERPFYNKYLQHQMIYFDSVIRKYFYDAYNKGLEKNEYETVDIGTVLDFLFSTINYYLSHNNLFQINTKRKIISNTFLTLIRSQ
jgi:AcrR family transcriptional regulator